jgi:hypothetical protein
MIPPEKCRDLLLELGSYVREKVIAGRKAEPDPTQLARVSRESVADTIYEIDRLSEEAIKNWFNQHWPKEFPIELVMEGIDPARPVTIPVGTPIQDTAFKCLLDPIDGTRCLMYDKRSAWFLAGLAPQHGSSTSLQDIQVAVMVELPTTRAWRSDCLSAIRGHNVQAECTNIFTLETTSTKLQPSTALDTIHGFASIARFFPSGKALTAALEEHLWRSLYPEQAGREFMIFDDQYISTGGQFYELLSGRDRFIADLRPLVFRTLQLDSALCCHPYDVCASLVLEEMGVVIEEPFGAPLQAPLDTTSAVAWVGYANRALAERIRPALREAILEVLGCSRP